MAVGAFSSRLVLVDGREADAADHERVALIIVDIQGISVVCLTELDYFLSLT